MADVDHSLGVREVELRIPNSSKPSTTTPSSRTSPASEATSPGTCPLQTWERHDHRHTDDRSRAVVELRRCSREREGAVFGAERDSSAACPVDLAHDQALPVPD